MQAMLLPPSGRRRPWVVAEPDTVSGAWYPNLRAGIIPTGPNQLWVSDITYVRLERAFVFLAVVLDVFSRKVIGYAIGPTLDARLPLAALDAAIDSRRPPPGCVHHSDRGSQPEFNRSLQQSHCVQIVSDRSALRQGCASPASCEGESSARVRRRPDPRHCAH